MTTEASAAPAAGAEPTAPASTEQTTSSAPVEPTTAPTAPSPVIGESFNWVPEQFRADETFKDFKSVEDVLTEFKVLKQVQKGHDENGFITLPKPDAPPEEFDAIFRKLGKPENPAEYGFKRPEDLPQGMDFSDERAAKFAQFAHENNLTKAQAEAAFGFYHNLAKEGYAEQVATIEQQLTTNLKNIEERWGAKQGTEAFQRKNEDAQRAFNLVADQKIVEEFKNDPFIQSNPLVLDVLSRLGAKLSSDSVAGLTKATPVGNFQGTFDKVAAKQKFIDDGKLKQLTSETNFEKRKALQSEWNSFFAVE